MLKTELKPSCIVTFCNIIFTSVIIRSFSLIIYLLVNAFFFQVSMLIFYHSMTIIAKFQNSNIIVAFVSILMSVFYSLQNGSSMSHKRWFSNFIEYLFHRSRKYFSLCITTWCKTVFLYFYEDCALEKSIFKILNKN